MSGRIDLVSVVAPGLGPDRLQDLRASYYRILDAAEAVSSEATAAGESLTYRIACRGLVDDVKAGIKAVNAALSQIARKGGRGTPLSQLGGKTPSTVPPELVGPPGCRGGTPAGMGHGCPAPAAAAQPLAVGSAPAASIDREHNHADHLLFFAGKSKNLQVGESHVTINAAGENNP